MTRLRNAITRTIPDKCQSWSNRPRFNAVAHPFVRGDAITNACAWLKSQSLKPLWLPWSQNPPRFKGVVIPCSTLNWEFERLVLCCGFRLPWHLLGLHVTQPHAASKSGEAVEEAYVQHARHFIIGWECGSRHAAEELALCFAACREVDTSECTASTAQARCASLAAKVALKAKDGFLCCTSNVVHFRHTTVVAAAASMVHNHLGLVNGVKVHPSLLWGRHLATDERVVAWKTFKTAGGLT